MKRTAAGILLLLGVALVVWNEAPAAEPVPAANQAALLMRILSYDRNLATRSPGAVHIGVVGDATGLLSALTSLAKRTSIKGYSVDVVPVPYSTVPKVNEELAKLKPAAIFVAEGLSDDAVGALAKTSQERSALSFTSNERYLKLGLAIGLVPREGRTGIVVNLPVAKAQGADLDSSLLRICEVLH